MLMGALREGLLMDWQTIKKIPNQKTLSFMQQILVAVWLSGLIKLRVPSIFKNKAWSYIKPSEVTIYL